MTTEKIYVGIDDERIELTGEALEAFIAERTIRLQQAEQRKAEADAWKAEQESTKATQRQAILDRLGLTSEEARLLLSQAQSSEIVLGFVADSGEATGLKYVAGVSIAFNAQTAAYTLVAGDAFKLVTISDTVSRTVTIPSSVFTAGQIINVQRIGTGAVPFAAGAGVTITSTGASAAAPTLRAQYSAASVVCTASNTFTVLGDIA